MSKLTRRQINENILAGTAQLLKHSSGKTHTHAAIADACHVARSTIRGIERKACRKIVLALRRDPEAAKLVSALDIDIGAALLRLAAKPSRRMSRCG